MGTNTPVNSATPTGTFTSTQVTPTPPATDTLTPTGTSTPVAPGTATPTATETVARVGDCNHDCEVDVSELLLGINIALGERSLIDCPEFDANCDGEVEINELVEAVDNLLDGCPTARGVSGLWLHR